MTSPAQVETWAPSLFEVTMPLDVRRQLTELHTSARMSAVQTRLTARDAPSGQGAQRGTNTPSGAPPLEAVANMDESVPPHLNRRIRLGYLSADFHNHVMVSDAITPFPRLLEPSAPNAAVAPSPAAPWPSGLGCILRIPARAP